MCSPAMRPASGTGHSTRPATSSSNPGSSTATMPLSAARRAMPPAMTLLRSSASTKTRCARSLAIQSSAPETGKAPGAWNRWPSVTAAGVRPCPSSLPSRRLKGTTAPSSRHTIRRSGRTQVKPLVPPQRMDLGQGIRRSTPGSAAASSAGAAVASACLSSTQYSPSWRACSRLAPCLRRKPSKACSGALIRGPRSEALTEATSALTMAARAMRRGPCHVRTSAGESPASASDTRRARSAAARACMRAGISSLNSSRKNAGMVSPSTRVRCRCGRNRRS